MFKSSGDGQHRHISRKVKQHWQRIALAALAVGVVLALYWPAQAAMLLSYFTAESTATSVVLSWGTASEINVDGYKIYCKDQDEPDSDYHMIGTVIAKGDQNLPAVYSFEVTQGVYYGEQYCFRLEEVTTDGVPGEKHDICGFGPGITPTPVVVSTLTIIAGAGTPVIVTPGANFTPPPTLITMTATPFGQSPVGTPSPTPFGGATATQDFSPIGTPTPTFTGFPTSTWTPTPTLVDGQGVSPLATPSLTAAPTLTPTAMGTVLASGFDDEDDALQAVQKKATAVSATETASAVGVSPLAAPTDSDASLGTPTAAQLTPVATSTPTWTVTVEATLPVSATMTLGPTQMAEPTQSTTSSETPPPLTQTSTEVAGGGASQSMEATPTHPYVVHTETPSSEAPTVAPTITALPTITPTPDAGMLGAFAPSAQNMVVMMLCLIFLSATGLGSLGLLLAVLYFRNQSQRQS